MVLPYFVELVDRGLTRGEVAVYGAVCAYQELGLHPSMSEIAAVTGLTRKHHCRTVQSALKSLELKGLISRKTVRPKFGGGYAAIEPLGPMRCCVRNQHDC